MSNNAHELSNRLLNALDSNYNVSLLVLSGISLISESEIRKRSARACDTRLESRLGLSRGCLAAAEHPACPLGAQGPVWHEAACDTWALRVMYGATDVASAPLVPPSLVPNVLQCESTELCHAWPFPLIFVRLCLVLFQFIEKRKCVFICTVIHRP